MFWYTNNVCCFQRTRTHRHTKPSLVFSYHKIHLSFSIHTHIEQHTLRQSVCLCYWFLWSIFLCVSISSFGKFEWDWEEERSARPLAILCYKQLHINIITCNRLSDLTENYIRTTPHTYAVMNDLKWILVERRRWRWYIRAHFIFKSLLHILWMKRMSNNNNNNNFSFTSDVGLCVFVSTKMDKKNTKTNKENACGETKHERERTARGAIVFVFFIQNIFSLHHFY